MIAYGLIAGLRYNDILEMEPGEVLDYFTYRQKYDDVQHHITRS